MILPHCWVLSTVVRKSYCKDFENLFGFCFVIELLEVEHIKVEKLTFWEPHNHNHVAFDE